MKKQNRFWLLCGLILTLLTLIRPVAEASGRDEFERAQKIAKEKRAGKNLSSEQKKILLKYVMRGWIADMDPSRTSVGFKPLSDMKASDRYKGEEGGLYGKGKNQPDKTHQAIIDKVLLGVRPRDEAGKLSDDGKIAMISIGMSNTTREFGVFIRTANADKRKASAVTLVDCAMGSHAGKQWAERAQVWENMRQKLKQKKVTPAQVQVAWIKLAEMGPSKYGAFPKHAQFFKNNIITILHKLQETCPNIKVVYFSSRVYAGYCISDHSLSPEPYVYESAFALRWLIKDQMKGDPELNYDAAKGVVKAPLLLWGPYMWCDGTNARADGLTWPPDLLEFDGVHPSTKGKVQVTQLLLKFFTTDKNAKSWFTRSE